MDFDKSRNSSSMVTVVEISKKITELLDSMEYSNTEMLITKEHIKHNLNQLIRYSTSKQNNIRNRIFTNKSNQNFSVDYRGKLKADFSFSNL